MQKIVPHLWFDKEAREAAELYVKAFQRSSIISKTVIPDTPSGDVLVMAIDLNGYRLNLMSAGPDFKFTPAVSFLVTCQTRDEVDQINSTLHVHGKELMPLGEYPWSPRYVWLQDRFGLSWQIMHKEDSRHTETITPALMFTKEQCGKAEEAIVFYTTVFPDSGIKEKTHFRRNEGPHTLELIKHSSFTLAGQQFSAMDSPGDHDFSFSEATSFVVYCETQDEIDYYWNYLSAYPEAEQCGWLKDRFGVSWQIVPRIMDKLMQEKDPEKLANLTQAMLKMKKLHTGELTKAAGW